jgi:hypothetical protein
VQRPLGASHQAAERTVAFAIGYRLPVNHLLRYCITDGESTARYLDIWSSAVFSHSGFAAIPEVLFGANLPGFWE